MVDPGWPFTLRVQVDRTAPRPAVIRISIEARSDQPVTSTVMSQIPMRQVTNVAVSAVSGEGETHYRMLARPRPRGARSWPEDHFQRVARVAAWARATGRPGGAAGAVAEFWAVHLRTARRWLSRAEASGRPSPRTQPLPSDGSVGDVDPDRLVKSR